MNVLLTAKMYGPANCLVGAARELLNKGHEVMIYATGNDNEVKALGDLPVKRGEPREGEYTELVRGMDVVVAGMSGFHTSDGYFIRAGNSIGVPTIAVADQNSNYVERLGQEVQYLPTRLAMMSEDCIATLGQQLPEEMGKEARRRARVIGWAAFDRYAALREGYTAEMREKFLAGMGFDADKKLYVHFTQNIHPQTAYMKKVDRPYERKVHDFLYEQGVTQFVFEAAADLGLHLVVKPHPGEEYSFNFTKELTKRFGRFGFTYIYVNECNTLDLLLAANAVTAGKSTCLTEATLLDRNTGGMLPEVDVEGMKPYPPLMLNAIPYTQTWEGIREVLGMVTSTDGDVKLKLAQDRRKFSVDGKASKRLVDLIEGLR